MLVQHLAETTAERLNPQHLRSQVTVATRTEERRLGGVALSEALARFFVRAVLEHVPAKLEEDVLILR